MDSLVPIKLPPGMRNTGTVYQSKGRWYTGNFVRFFQDTIQPIGGWSAMTTTGLSTGTPRSVLAYTVNGSPMWIVGTTGKAYALSAIGSGSATVTDISFGGISTQTTRMWQFASFGEYLYATDCYSGIQYYWDGNTAHTLTKIPNGKSDGIGGLRDQVALGCTVTPERFAVQLGGEVTNSTVSAFGASYSNDRLVQWASQEGITAQSDWEGSATNTAGWYVLPGKGSLRAGRPMRNTTLLWTTADLWTMNYVGGEFIYSFTQAGDNCGIIAMNAAVVIDTTAYWMGEAGFYRYDGFVQPIPCDVQDYVFGSFNRTYAHLVWAIENPQFGEVTWFYPHAAQTECTRYVTYNYRENHWVTGSLGRACGAANAQRAGYQTLPVMVDTSRSVFLHETGTARNSEGTPSLESGPIELGDGDHLMSVQKVLPDDKTVGDVNLTIYTAADPDSSETSNGPYTLTHQTSVRLKARQIRLKLTEATAAAWRVGVVRLGLLASSRR